MDKNVGSVDLEELKKAREELNRERGIETDPNMYNDYNPNRSAEESTDIASTDESVRETSDSSIGEFVELPVWSPAEAPAEDLTQKEDPDDLEEVISFGVSDDEDEITISTTIPEEESFDVDSEIDDLLPDSVKVENEKENQRVSSERDFSVYDNFAAFDVENESSSNILDDMDEDAQDEADEADSPNEDDSKIEEPTFERVNLLDEFVTERSSDAQSFDEFETISNVGILGEETNDSSDDYLGGLDDEISATDEESIQNAGFDVDVNVTADDDDEIIDPTANTFDDSAVLTSLENAMKEEDGESDLTETEEESDAETDELQSEEIEESTESDEKFVEVDPLEEEPEDVNVESIEESIAEPVEETTAQELIGEELEVVDEVAKPEQSEEGGLEIVDNYKKLSELLREEELEAERLQAEKLKVLEPEKVIYPALEEFNFIDVIALEEFKKGDKLSYLLGKDESGFNVYGNLRDFYNMVVFGKANNATTSVVHSILLSLILKNTIQEVNFVICDSKADSKFEIYNTSSYMYFNRIAKTNKEILDTLIEVTKELEERYKILAAAGVKSIEQYNTIARNDNMKELPYIVTVFNNYSKSIQLTEADKINACMYQILKLGRIVGMYLIVIANTTIRSEEINYNLPTRISFKVDEEFDSVSTLGSSGAELLESADEFLYSTIDNEKVTHIKAPSITETEIELLVQNIED